MEIQGKVIAVLPERSGVSARGEWKSQTYVIETQEQYPKKMAFDVFGADRIASFGIHSGEVINVSFDIDAHEYHPHSRNRYSHLYDYVYQLQDNAFLPQSPAGQTQQRIILRQPPNNHIPSYIQSFL